MTNFAKAPTLSNETINTVESIEAQVVNLRGDKKVSDEAINAHKVNQYAELIAAIAADRKPTGKFERGYGTKLKSDLHEFAGIPEATAKRLGENAVNAVKLIHDKIGDIPTQYTADNKLVKAIKENRGGAVDKVEKLARSVVGFYGTTVNKDTGDAKVNKTSFLNGLSDEDLETFEARIAELIEVRREFAAASEAAQAAEEAKKAENEAVKAAEAALANAA